MEAQNPLSELADIHLPETSELVLAWPPAIGWWILLVLLFAASAYTFKRWYTKHLREKKLQAALNELDSSWQQYQMEQAFSSNNKGKAGIIFLNEINSILKRVALVHFYAEDIASLNGLAWLKFLDHCTNNNEFQQHASEGLGDALYRKTFEGDPEPIYTLARQWIMQRYTQLKKPTANYEDELKNNALTTEAKV